MALVNLVRIRPGESTAWFLEGIQMDDWMTANMAMDSLVDSRFFVPDDLIRLLNEPGVSEEVHWRIIYIFGHRYEPESVPVLLKALRSESWLVHTEAAVGLCRFNPEQIIPEMEALKNDPRPYIRNNSRWVIRQVSDLQDE
jgi:HEAT repeat protein